MGALIGLMFGAGLVIALWQPPAVRRVARRQNTAVHWPQFIDDVASGIRAGLSVPAATFEAGQRLIYPYPAIFAEWHESWQQGSGFESALAGLRASIDCAPFDQFAQTMDLAYRQGGRAVATLLSQLARNVRAQEQLVHEVRGRQSVTVTSAKVAVAAPWVVLVVTAARPEVRHSYMSATGVWVLIGVAGICVMSYVAMRRMAEIAELQVMR